MDSFSFIYSFFAIVLGLALTELLGGFGKALQSRKKVQVGLLAPLLGLVVALDITSFWIWAWLIRNVIPLNYLSLMCGLVLAGLYYLVARVTFPDEPAEWPDYDLYYFEHRRIVIGGVLLCNLLASTFSVVLGLRIFGGWLSVLPLACQLGLSAMIFASRTRRYSLAGLILLAVCYPAWPIIGMVTS